MTEGRGSAQARQPVIDKQMPRSKRILLLAWPVTAQMFLQTLAQIVDMAMVGRLGKAAIAAVGLSFRPLFVGQAIFLGLGVATTALVARNIGAGDRDTATHAAEQSLLTTSVLAFLLAAFGYIFAKQITLFMGAEDEVIGLGATYLKGFSPGLMFLMLGTIMTAALRGAGDTKTPFYAGVISNVVNVVGNYVLIFGKLGFPALGVFGAAVATSFSRVVAAVIMFAVLVRGRGGLHLKWQHFSAIDWSMVTRLFRIGIPAALERFIQSFAMMLHVKILATLGTTAVAVSTLSGNIEQLSFMPSIGFAVAASTLVGQNLGANQPEEAEKSGWGAMKLCALFMGVMGVLFILIPHVFVRIYTNDPTVVEPAKTILRIVGLTQLPQALAFVASGGLRGAGDTTAVLWIGALGNMVLRIGISYIAIVILGWGLWSAYLAVLVDWLVRSSLLVVRFKSGRWKEVEV